MKKTNVMIEVTDDIYEDIVAPFKKKKSFGKLITMLLEAYANNDSIYSYINGAMDGLENEATEELLKDLNSMAESLSMLGALSSEAEAVIDNGQRAFDDFSTKATEDAKKVKETNGISREDVVEIVEDSVSEIKDMLKQLLSNGVTVNSTINTPKSEEKVPEEKYVAEEISKEDEEKAQNALASLMGSLGM